MSTTPGDGRGRPVTDDAHPHSHVGATGGPRDSLGAADPADGRASHRVRLDVRSRDPRDEGARPHVDLDPHPAPGGRVSGVGHPDPLGDRMTRQLGPGLVDRSVVREPPGRRPGLLPCGVPRVDGRGVRCLGVSASPGPVVRLRVCLDAGLPLRGCTRRGPATHGGVRAAYRPALADRPCDGCRAGLLRRLAVLGAAHHGDDGDLHACLSLDADRSTRGSMRLRGRRRAHRLECCVVVLVVSALRTRRVGQGDPLEGQHEKDRDQRRHQRARSRRLHAALLNNDGATGRWGRQERNETGTDFW